MPSYSFRFRHNLLDNKPIYVAENVDGIPPPLITSCIIACGGRVCLKYTAPSLPFLPPRV